MTGEILRLLAVLYLLKKTL